MTTIEKEIYETIFENSILFLKKAITELVNNHDDSRDEELSNETAKISTVFIQMAIELAIKAFLLKRKGIDSILETKYKGRGEKDLIKAFKKNTLRTRSFDRLKKVVLDDEGLNIFSEDTIFHINQFQTFRNKIVHINLFLEEGDIFDLKYELIQAMVHVVIPLLIESRLEIENAAEFISKYLRREEFLKLISYEPYIYEMNSVAKENSEFVHKCWVCNNKTFAVEDSKCYSCGNDWSDAIEYTDCVFCHSRKSVIFDPLNIENNGNRINALCLSCNERPIAFKCSKCGMSKSFVKDSDILECC